MGPEFVVVLLTALLLALGLGYWQQQSYARAVARIAADHSGPTKVLVTGRGKGFSRGAIVILVVDSTTRTVVDATVMAGSTVFARPRQAPELLGSIRGVEERARGEKVKQAIAMAIEQYQRVVRQGAHGSRGASPAGSG